MAASRSGVQLLLPGLGQESALIGAAELAFGGLLDAPDAITAGKLSDLVH